MAKEIKDHTFSLVEYLMIVMIIGILIVFIVPFTQANKAQPKIREMKNNVNSILEAYDQTGELEGLKLNDVDRLNDQDLLYSIAVNDFLKYVNFEKEFAKKHLNLTKKREYVSFLRNEVRPLVKIAYLAKFDQYVDNIELVKLKFDYDVLPNLGSFLEDDKFFEFYDLAENRLINFVIPGLEESYNTEIIDTIQFVKGLKPEGDYYHLSYDQIRRFSNINLVDITNIEDQFFAYKLNADSTIVATTTENFGTSGAQIIYNMTDEVYEIGPKRAYEDLGHSFIEESISNLSTYTNERDEAITQFVTNISPEDFDVKVNLINEKNLESLLMLEAYIIDNFRYQDINIYLDFYNNFNSTISNTIANNRKALEKAIDDHDKMKKPTTKAKNEITEKVDNWELLTNFKAKIENRIKSLNSINDLQLKVVSTENHKSLRDNYIKSFNVIDQDWLILE